MAASGVQFQPETSEGDYDIKFHSLAATTTIWDGTMAMNDGGDAKPFTDTGFQGGAKFLGCARGTYTNPDAQAADQLMTFARGGPRLVPEAKVNDVPTQAMVGGIISLADDNTVKATKGATDIAVILHEIRSDGYLVRLP